MTGSGRFLSKAISKFNAIWRLLLAQKQPLNLKNPKSVSERPVESAGGEQPLAYYGCDRQKTTRIGHKQSQPRTDSFRSILHAPAPRITVYISIAKRTNGPIGSTGCNGNNEGSSMPI